MSEIERRWKHIPVTFTTQTREKKLVKETAAIRELLETTIKHEKQAILACYDAITTLQKFGDYRSAEKLQSLKDEMSRHTGVLEEIWRMYR